MTGDVVLIGFAVFFAFLAPLSIWIPRRMHDQVAYLSIVLAICAIGLALLLAFPR